MKIYNSSKKKKEEFQPIEKGKLKMYVCGPTVYDVPHLGHGRSAVAFDVIRRYFIYQGYDVKYVSNYTDVDDKMINRAKEEGITVTELADKVIPVYEEEYGRLGILEPDALPRATEYVDSMKELIVKLNEKGYVYVLEDGIYYDVSKYEGYGRLSGQKLEDLQMGARVEVNENKRNPYDFVLWKFRKAEGEPGFSEAEMSWESPLGCEKEGRPGWHLECSAMTWKELGEKFDIHGGGLDLQFPHHECEVAQSCSAFGEGSFAKYWMHNGFINVDNEKMSKSLGNFFSLGDIFEKYDPKVVRLMFLQTHYRNPINFSDKLLDQAKAGLERIRGIVRNLRNGYEKLPDTNNETYEKVYRTELEKYSKEFEKYMDDDFNTSGALSVVFNIVDMGFESIYRKVLTKKLVRDFESTLEKIDEVLGIIFHEEKNLNQNVEKLIKEREEARENKDFERADEIRDELAGKGVILEDTPDGVVWKNK